MHYSKSAFAISSGSITIRTLDATKQNVIGQRNGMSATDIKELHDVYKLVLNLLRNFFNLLTRDLWRWQ